jgi:hypothetical protein
MSKHLPYTATAVREDRKSIASLSAAIANTESHVYVFARFLAGARFIEVRFQIIPLLINDRER